MTTLLPHQTARRSFWTQIQLANASLSDTAASRQDVQRLFDTRLDTTTIDFAVAREASNEAASDFLGLGKQLIQEIDDSQKAGEGGIPGSWETLVTQSVVPKLLSRTRTADARYPWEVTSLVAGRRTEVSYPESCVRILGVLRLIGRTGRWGTNVKTRRGDPLLTAAAAVARNKGINLSALDNQDAACRIINLLYDAAMIYLSATAQVHLVSPIAAGSYADSRKHNRPSLFFGGADDHAHIEMGLIANNWLGGLPVAEKAWAAWKLASEIGPSGTTVMNIFAYLDGKAGIDPPGRTLESEQQKPGREPVVIPTFPPAIPTAPPPGEMERLQSRVTFLEANVLELQSDNRKLQGEVTAQEQLAARSQELQRQLAARSQELIAARKEIQELKKVKTVRTPQEAIKQALEPIKTQLNVYKQFVKWLGVPAGSQILLGVVPVLLLAEIDFSEYLVSEPPRPVVVRVISGKVQDLGALRAKQAPTGRRLLLSFEQPHIDKHFGPKAVLRVNQRLATKPPRRRRPAPPIGKLTQTFIGSVLVAAKDRRVGEKMIHENSLEWAKAAVEADRDRLQLKRDLVDLSRGIIHDNSRIRDTALRRICTRVPSINGYRDDFSALASQAAKAASNISVGIDAEEDVRKCLESARVIGDSMQRRW